jgi:hypothetical protein
LYSRFGNHCISCKADIPRISKLSVFNTDVGFDSNYLPKIANYLVGSNENLSFRFALTQILSIIHPSNPSLVANRTSFGGEIPGVNRRKRRCQQQCMRFPKFLNVKSSSLCGHSEYRIDSWKRVRRSGGILYGKSLPTRVPSKVPLDFFRIRIWLNLKEIGSRRTRLRS